MMKLTALILLGMLVALTLAQDAQEEYPSSYELAQAHYQLMQESSGDHLRQKRGLEGVLLDVGGGGGGWKKKKKKAKKAQIAIPIKKVIKVRKVKKGWEDDWEDGWKEPEYIKFAIPKINIPLKLVKKKSKGWH